MEYLTRWRMLLAADRLKTSTDGLSAIATSLGYESESAFGKAFRRVMGYSPRQYARSAAPATHTADHVARSSILPKFGTLKGIVRLPPPAV